MLSKIKIIIPFCFLIQLTIFNVSELKASPDTTSVNVTDTLIPSPLKTSAHIDTFIDNNDPPFISNKFNRFKRLFDKIILPGGDTLTVLINNVNEATVVYSFPLNYRKESLDKKLIKSLIYSDGRIETIPGIVVAKFEKQIPAKFSEKDWDKVMILKSIDESAGIADLGEIESRFEGDRINVNSAYLEKSAMILLKKKAARLGANLIYVSKKDEYRAYGEMPNMTITARAFSKP